MKKNNILLEKHIAVTTTLAQHTATQNNRGLATQRWAENPDIILKTNNKNFLNNLNF